MKVDNDRLTFWRGWYEGARRYPDEQRLAVYDAIFAFAFCGQEPAEPSGDLTSAIVFQTISTIRSTITISRKRREFGSIGGSKAKAKSKQTRSKAKAKRNQEQVQEQVQEQEQEHNAISITATPAHVRVKKPTLSVFISAGHLSGVADDQWLRDLYKELVDAGWADREGRKIGNWRRYLKTAYIDSQKKMRGACDSDDQQAARHVERDWE